MKKVLCAAIFVFSFTVNLSAEIAAGTTVFNFLKIPLNASQAAMSGIGAFNLSSSGSNPAMIPFHDKVFFSASYAAYFQDTSFNSLNITIPLKNAYHGIDISYGGFNYGSMDSYIEDTSGNYIKNGTFDASDAFLGFSYGRMITNEIYAGAGLKYVWQTIDDSKISGLALSLAALYITEETWYVAGGIDNAGFQVEGYDLPSSVYVSIVDTPEELNSTFEYGAELRVFLDDTMWLKGACEYNYKEILFARLGYRLPLNNSSGTLGDWLSENLSVGFGVEYGFFGIDYAWVPFGELGNTSMLSLQIYF